MEGRGERGFTLLETVVALAVFAGALLMLVRGLGALEELRRRSCWERELFERLNSMGDGLHFPEGRESWRNRPLLYCLERIEGEGTLYSLEDSKGRRRYLFFRSDLFNL